jgi:hypothetical protein
MAAYQINNTAKEYSFKISSSKTKSTGMCANEIQRLKIMIEGKIAEQATEFNSLGWQFILQRFFSN